MQTFTFPSVSKRFEEFTASQLWNQYIRLSLLCGQVHAVWQASFGARLLYMRNGERMFSPYSQCGVLWQWKGSISVWWLRAGGQKGLVSCPLGCSQGDVFPALGLYILFKSRCGQTELVNLVVVQWPTVMGRWCTVGEPGNFWWCSSHQNLLFM